MDARTATQLAAATGLNIAPTYEVEQLEGFVERTVVEYKRVEQPIEQIRDSDTGEVVKVRTRTRFERIENKVREPAGYMVYTARGDAFRVSSADLHHMGLNRPASLVDMDSGDELPDMAIPSLKDRIRFKAGRLVDTVQASEPDEDED